MSGVDLLAKPVGGNPASRVALKAESVCDGRSEKGVSKRGEDEPQGRLTDVMLLMTDAEPGDQRAQRVQNRIECVAVAGKDHPRRECAGAFAVEGVEGQIDHFASVRFMRSGTAHGLGDVAGDAIRDEPRELRLEPGRRAEMVKQIGMGAADLGSDRL